MSRKPLLKEPCAACGGPYEHLPWCERLRKQRTPEAWPGARAAHELCIVMDASPKVTLADVAAEAGLTRAMVGALRSGCGSQRTYDRAAVAVGRIRARRRAWPAAWKEAA